MPAEKKFLTFPFELKAEDLEETGIFKGYGAVFGNKDSHHDIIMPGAFTNTLLKGGRNGNGVAMLLQHDARRPIGVWNLLAEDKKGLKVEGQLVMKTKDGQETYELMKAGALKGLSIGYDTIIDEVDKKKRVRYLKEIALWEISPVVFASNIRAVITAVKEFKELIKQATTERELEKALRESDIFSKNDAQHVISLIKSSLREAEIDNKSEIDNDTLFGILDSLKMVNRNIQTAEILGSLKEINL